MTDRQLLQAFGQSADEAAFAQLVSRHMAMVYEAARRQVRDPGMAEDVAQAVFIILAKKAGSIRDGSLLSGWLIKVTRFVSRDALKAEARRRQHEQQAAVMLSATFDPQPAASQIEPMLDEALARLGGGERSVLALHYLEGKPLAEVAADMDISTVAARKRLSRALAKLRSVFAGQGVMLSVGELGVVMSHWGSASAPPALAGKIAAGALAASKGAGAAAGMAGVAGGLAKGVLIMMAMKKAAVVGGCLAAILLMGTAVKVAVTARRPGSAVAAAPALAPAPVNPRSKADAPSTFPVTKICATRERFADVPQGLKFSPAFVAAGGTAEWSPEAKHAYAEALQAGLVAASEGAQLNSEQMRTRSLEQAIAASKEYVRQYPANPGSPFRLHSQGICYSALGQAFEAKQAHQAARQMIAADDPFQNCIDLGLAEAHRVAGETLTAEQILRRIIAQPIPEQPLRNEWSYRGVSAPLALSKLLLEQDKPGAAEQVLIDSIERALAQIKTHPEWEGEPDGIDMLYNQRIGLIMNRSGDAAAARRVAEEFNHRFPDYDTKKPRSLGLGYRGMLSAIDQIEARRESKP